MPDLTVADSEYIPFITSVCFLRFRKSVIQFHNAPLNPNVFSLCASRLCGTLLKAFTKSKYIISVLQHMSESWFTCINVARSFVSDDDDGMKPCCLLVIVGDRFSRI